MAECGTYGIVFYDPESNVIVPQSEMPEFRGLKQTTVYDIRSFNGNDLYSLLMVMACGTIAKVNR